MSVGAPNVFGLTCDLGLDADEDVPREPYMDHLDFLMALGGGDGFEEEYEVLEELGRGAHGTVACVRSREDGTLFALKRVALLPRNVDEEKHLKHLRAEVETMQLCSGVEEEEQRVVGLVRAWCDKDNLFLLMEHMDCGSVAELLEGDRPKLPVPVMAHIVRCLCEAVAFLKSHNIMHRDIKPENILISSTGKVKLADCGLAGRMNAHDRDLVPRSHLNTAVGDLAYIAKERFAFDPDSDVPLPYSVKADISSIGISMLELALRYTPFRQNKRGGPEMNALSIIDAITSNQIPPFPEHLYPLDTTPGAEDMRDMIEECTDPDPEDRPTPAELLDMPFLQFAKQDELVAYLAEHVLPFQQQ